MPDGTFATLFSGGELAGVGIRAAGYEHVWGIDNNQEVVEVAQTNGFTVGWGDILGVDPRKKKKVYALHASPPCTNASIASQRVKGSKETALDIALGEKVSEFIQVLKPHIFTLENVWLYRNFKAFNGICKTLSEMGYTWMACQLNAADFGVPQTRRRLILRAVRSSKLLSPLPAPVPWVGWYSAIEDLIPDLPASEFAPWQMARLPEDIRQSVLVDGQNAHVNTGVPTLRFEDQPAFTVSAGGRRAHTRALLLPGSGNTNFRDAKPGGGVRYADEPAHVVSSGGGGRLSRAWLEEGRVVLMTPRALARFQSVPDSYWLPDKRDLARRIVGNGVPSLLMQRIYESF